MAEKRVAVIAVHGVGHHEPRASARAMAEMLLRTPRREQSRYTSFREMDVQVPTRRLESSAKRSAEDDPAPWRSLSERSAHPRDSADPQADHLLMSEQLAGYRPDEADGFYETVRLEARHLADGRTGSTGETGENVDADVHVYEFYWSDISRIGPGLLSLFGAFYQLVIHLPYIGRSTIEFARAREKEKRPAIWKTLSVAHTWAMRSLTLFVPTLNMVMLALGLALLVRHVPATYESRVAVGVVAAAALVLAAAAMYWSSVPWRGISIVLPLLAGGAIIEWLPRVAEPRVWLLYEAWVVTALALVGVLVVFQKNRPGALPLGLALLATTLVLLGVYTPGAGGSLTAIVLPVLEWEYFGLSIAWAVFGGALLVLMATGAVLTIAAFADNEATDSAARSMLNRAVYTSRFALALPAVAFSVATLLVWGMLVTAESKTAFDKEGAYTPVFRYPALIAHVRYDEQRSKFAPGDTTQGCAITGDAGRETVRCAPAYFIRTFAGALDTPWGVAGSAVTLLAVLIVVIVLFPVIWTELKSPQTPPPGRPDRFAGRSIRLGYWLDFAFGAARISGELLGFSCLIAFVGLLTVFPTPAGALSQLVSTLQPAATAQSGIGFSSYGGLLLGGASTLSILAVIRVLSSASSGLRPALGIATDVDNYLRELPRDRTPRARMAERYASLLRYVCEWRGDAADPQSGYDAVVIVAHSQGTVITADLLRYFEVEAKNSPSWEPKLRRLRGSGRVKPLPVFLFTMGSPLRQLYAQRFPHLYGWVCAKTGHATGPDGAELLGVENRRWMNVYRSADYVGRRLWEGPKKSKDEYTPSENPTPAEDGDACIGPGAHTHYWDTSADWVAVRLGALIDEIIAGVRSGPQRTKETKPATYSR